MGTWDTLTGTVDDTTDSLEDSADYAGDVLLIRDDPEDDRFDGEEYLTDQTWFDAVWEHGDETGEDTRDLPGSALWGTDDSFTQDPVEATSSSLSDLWAVGTGDFDYQTPDGGGDGAPDTDIPWKLVGGGLLLLAVLVVLRPYVELGADAAGAV